MHLARFHIPTYIDVNEANVCFNDVAAMGLFLLSVTAKDLILDSLLGTSHYVNCIFSPFMCSEHLRLVARGSYPIDYSCICFRMVRKLFCTFIINILLVVCDNYM